MNSSFTLYLVKTDKKNPRHHGLHTNTSSHVLTRRPSPGDLIDFVCEGEINRYFSAVENGQLQTGGYGWIALWSQTAEKEFDTVGLKITTHGGRSALLGEDGFEEAFGNSIDGVLLEMLNGAEWHYAPVTVEPFKITKEEEVTEYQFQFSRNVNGQGQGWTLKSDEVTRKSA